MKLSYLHLYHLYSIYQIEREREQHLMPCIIPIVPPPQQMASPEAGSYSPAVIVLDTEKTYSPSDNHTTTHPIVRSEMEEEEVVMVSNGKNDNFNELDKYQDAPLPNNSDFPLPESLNQINNYDSDDDSGHEYPLGNNDEAENEQSSPPPILREFFGWFIYI